MGLKGGWVAGPGNSQIRLKLKYKLKRKYKLKLLVTVQLGIPSCQKTIEITYKQKLPFD